MLLAGWCLCSFSKTTCWVLTLVSRTSAEQVCFFQAALHPCYRTLIQKEGVFPVCSVKKYFIFEICWVYCFPPACRIEVCWLMGLDFGKSILAAYCFLIFSCLFMDCLVICFKSFLGVEGRLMAMEFTNRYFLPF